MLKGNLLKGVSFVFRRIHGRVIPISIRSGMEKGALITRARRIDQHREIGSTLVALNTMGNKARAMMHSIGVNSRFAGQGLGKTLMAHTIKAVQKHAPDVKWLHGNVFNPRQVSVRSGFHTKFLSRVWHGKSQIISTAKAAVDANTERGVRAITRVR